MRQSQRLAHGAGASRGFHQALGHSLNAQQYTVGVLAGHGAGRFFSTGLCLRQRLHARCGVVVFQGSQGQRQHGLSVAGLCGKALAGSALQFVGFVDDIQRFKCRVFQGLGPCGGAGPTNGGKQHQTQQGIGVGGCVAGCVGAGRRGRREFHGQRRLGCAGSRIKLSMMPPCRPEPGRGATNRLPSGLKGGSGGMNALARHQPGPPRATPGQRAARTTSSLRLRLRLRLQLRLQIQRLRPFNRRAGA